MRRLFFIILLCLLFFGATSPSATHAQPRIQQNGITVSLEPSTDIPQGKMGLVHVYGSNIQEVRGTFIGASVSFYPTSVGSWVGFLAVDMEIQPGAQSLDISVLQTDNQTPIQLNQPINVVWGSFDYQDIPIPYNLESLLDPELNAYDFDTLARVYRRITPERLFTDFMQPVPGPAISAFGGIRNYNNGTLRGRHTGSDYRAVTGTPIGAASEGRVIFAAHLPIHGNHIVVDHGWGILTGYSHMSEIFVVPGQLVRQGDTIGLVGATGRVQGPHLHFEVTVNGYWIDPVQFLDFQIPLAAPKQANSGVS